MCNYPNPFMSQLVIYFKLPNNDYELLSKFNKMFRKSLYQTKESVMSLGSCMAPVSLWG